jgi:hypothetical protein
LEDLMDENTTTTQTEANPSASEDASKPKTYTEADLEKAKQEALTKAGRDAKTLEERAHQLTVRERSLKIKELATKEGIDEATLLEFADLAPEKLESLAKKLGAAKVALNTSQPKPILKADSGVTTGGSSDYNTIRDAYIANPNNPKVRADYMKARRERVT